MRYVFGVLGGVLFLVGCGIQMPVTEGLVFSSSDPYGQKHEEILPFIRYGGAVTVVSAMPMHSALEEAAVGEHGSEQSPYLSQDFMRNVVNPGFGFSFGNGRRVAVAFSPGLILTGMHMDATVRTIEKVFATVNYRLAVENGGELIIQRPILEKAGGGLSVGAFFRTQPMQFVEKEGQWSGGEPTFNVQWYGLRLMGQSPDLSGSKINVRGFINAGYTRKYRTPLMAVGVTIAFD
ncbi:hypothetical protein [Fodinibius salsisoli]|uniref:Lipoprotein n=1 Tax=Fodinibius salsisoli TaxID=2820877 RepID=A0ABT3PNK6_9BACT|nr:hypothetical protein [Fodinibius salsisoli]MCW9707440.1 hypothetical protein [Fodinibius salsisoli]